MKGEPRKGDGGRGRAGGDDDPFTTEPVVDRPSCQRDERARRRPYLASDSGRVPRGTRSAAGRAASEAEAEVEEERILTNNPTAIAYGGDRAAAPFCSVPFCSVHGGPVRFRSFPRSRSRSAFRRNAERYLSSSPADNSLAECSSARVSLFATYFFLRSDLSSNLRFCDRESGCSPPTRLNVTARRRVPRRSPPCYSIADNRTARHGE